MTDSINPSKVVKFASILPVSQEIISAVGGKKRKKKVYI